MLSQISLRYIQELTRCVDDKGEVNIDGIKYSVFEVRCTDGNMTHLSPFGSEVIRCDPNVSHLKMQCQQSPEC